MSVRRRSLNDAEAKKFRDRYANSDEYSVPFCTSVLESQRRPRAWFGSDQADRSAALQESNNLVNFRFLGPASLDTGKVHRLVQAIVRLNEASLATERSARRRKSQT